MKIEGRGTFSKVPFPRAPTPSKHFVMGAFFIQKNSTLLYQHCSESTLSVKKIQVIPVGKKELSYKQPQIMLAKHRSHIFFILLAVNT